MSIAGRKTVVTLTWAAVGLMLIWRGLPYAGFREVDGLDAALSGSDRWIALGAALIVGIGKGMTALRKGARRAVTHIEMRAQAPFWSVFSPVMILLVGAMVALGLTLRHAPYDAQIKAWVVGILYPAIGVALIVGGLLVRTAAPLPKK